jgi:hypothetical protein
MLASQKKVKGEYCSIEYVVHGVISRSLLKRLGSVAPGLRPQICRASLLNGESFRSFRTVRQCTARYTFVMKLDLANS